jgi:hypothetical protein
MVAVRALMMVIGTIGWPFFSFPVACRNLADAWKAQRDPTPPCRGICSAHVCELRLREALEWCGWPEEYLSLDRRDARITWRKRAIGYEPWWRWCRWLHPTAFLPVEELLSRIREIRFDGVLRGDLGFVGLFEPPAGDDFPFDEFLAVSRPIETLPPSRWLPPPRQFDIRNHTAYYRVDFLALTFTHEVTVRIAAKT